MKSILIFAFLLGICLPTQAQIRLPKLISDNMVLKRDQPIKIWGWASPKEKFELNFNKKTFKTTTADNGKFSFRRNRPEPVMKWF